MLPKKKVFFCIVLAAALSAASPWAGAGRIPPRCGRGGGVQAPSQGPLLLRMTAGWKPSSRRAPDPTAKDLCLLGTSRKHPVWQRLLSTLPEAHLPSQQALPPLTQLSPCNMNRQLKTTVKWVSCSRKGKWIWGTRGSQLMCNSACGQLRAAQPWSVQCWCYGCSHEGSFVGVAALAVPRHFCHPGAAESPPVAAGCRQHRRL